MSQETSSRSRGLATFRHVARSVPLGAAIVAPLITLLDIPALSQRWYLVDGEPGSDPTASIAMSVVSLAFCALGNALLIVRFSSNVPSVRALVVEAPLCAFWLKTAVEVVNLSLFGRIDTKPDNYSYGEGFWCAVFSCGLSGVVAMLLLLHFVVQRKQQWKDSIKIRVDGRHFMLSVLSFVSVIGIQALVYSKIEGWFYFDGIYFSVVTCLTVGLGDFVPTKTSTKVLLVPFTLLSITLLANQISMIIGYFSHQSHLRRNKYRAQRLLLAQQGRTVEDEQAWGLAEEMSFLTRMQERERKASQMYNLTISLISFLAFWTVGAAIFHVAEGWTYGDSMYFSYVFFTSIGFGDFAPASSLGRVFFVLYALWAVPVVASFAVQTLTTIIEQVSDRRLTAARTARQDHIDQERPSSPAEDELHPHAHFVLAHWNELEEGIEDQAEKTSEERRESQTKLADEALALACQLESVSRSLLINTMPKGSKAQILLRADRNVQRRDIKVVSGGSSTLSAIWEEEDALAGASEEDLLRSVRRYRETFARLLVVGARLRRLEGTNRQAFLRVREDREDAGTHDEGRAQREMEEMNATDGDVEVQTEDGAQLEVTVKHKEKQ